MRQSFEHYAVRESRSHIHEWTAWRLSHWSVKKTGNSPLFVFMTMTILLVWFNYFFDRRNDTE